MAIASSRPVLCSLLVTLAACARDAPPRASPEARPVADAAVASPPAETAVAPSLTAPGSSGPPAGEPAPQDAGRPAVAATDGGPAAALPLPLAAAVAVVGGRDLPIERDGSALVDTGASFRVEVTVPLTDGRLALHDEQDAMVASSGTSEVGASWTRYRLVPDDPLRPGSAYTLRLDGAVTREAHDPSGRAYGPLELKVKTTGERPPPPPSRKKRGKRRS